MMELSYTLYLKVYDSMYKQHTLKQYTFNTMNDDDTIFTMTYKLYVVCLSINFQQY